MTLRILQLTDLHLTADPHDRVKGVPTHESLRDVVDHIARSADPFDCVVVTGDVTHHGEPAAYRAARELLGDRCPPSHIIPGNLDNRSAIREAFGHIVPAGNGSLGFSSLVGNWRLIGLDTLVDGQVSGFISPDQLDWLAFELSREPARPAAIFMHHPPVPVGCTWLDAIGLCDPEPFLELIARSPHVRAICSGHVHLESTRRVGQATVYTSPSTCLQFDPRSDIEPIFHQIPPGYRVVELHQDRFETRVVRLPQLKFPPTPANAES